jgi:hypothetical protein
VALGVTRFIDRATLEIWKRLETKNSTTPDLSRVWTLDTQSSEKRPDGSVEPFDVDRFLKRATD